MENIEGNKKRVRVRRSVEADSSQGEQNVVKSNRLNAAVHNLTLPEMRLIQLAIVIARATTQGLTVGRPLRIHALQYAKVFNVGMDTAYKMMKASEESLFGRQFTFVDEVDTISKGRWLELVKYLPNNGAIEITFTPTVVKEIFQINGAKKFFTQYALKQTAPLRSLYSLRLYELTVQWLAAGQTKVIEVDQLREQLEVGPDQYKAMNNFKLRVLESSIEEINSATDLTLEYEQVKAGRKIVGFRFFVTKDENKEIIDEEAVNEEVINPDIVAKKLLECSVVLTEKQALKFSRILINDPKFAIHIPAHYRTKEQKLKHLRRELRTPVFVSTYKTELEKAGFNFASGMKVDNFSNDPAQEVL